MLLDQRVFQPANPSFHSVYPAVYPHLRFGVLPRPAKYVAVDPGNLVERADPVGHDPIGSALLFRPQQRLSCRLMVPRFSGHLC